LQADLFESSRVQPEAVADAFFDFMNVLNTGTAEQLERLVPEQGYREALLKLTRNVAPAGKRVREIGIYRPRHGRIQAVYLTDAIASRVKDALPRKQEADSPREELYGILRALHLDENWLELTLQDGTHQKCNTLPDMLDDVVGPMVNRRVHLTGPRRRLPGGIVRLIVEDIELAED
jgi:hypothetical protein